MIACPVCRTENRDDARFCNNCGSRLSVPSALAEERKVITALFCDLVGFTATSEGADPEDVDRMLSGYAAMARREVEAHGGVVEKFIGDAVVGVFGVPAAHEDDPERAVRAALRICQGAATLPALRGQPLRLRVGVNTGEAFVRLEVGPTTGDRFLAGDTVNTASRIQSVAPEMGVAVGLATYEATRRRFTYEELPPATLKGKAEPVRVFRPVAPVARLGNDLTIRPGNPFVGRTRELAVLTEQFEAAIASRSLRFATISGEAGLGKSRLVGELLSQVAAQPMLVTWRQGRCLPYGTGITFWALGEIVKAQSGILESDSAEVARGKLDRAIPDIPEHTWLRERLLPLIGIESSRAEREEQFSAWGRFVELLAADGPAVVVFEDLHWADEPMLAFLEDLAVRAPAVPLLVVGTTRPELFDGRRDFPGPGAAASRIDLQPLTADDSAQIAADLAGTQALSATLLEPLTERSGGNPLFVEELVRLLLDRDLLAPGDDGLGLRPGAALPTPDSVQGVLAARLDALPGALKAVLGDAAVVGKVFWAGAAAAIEQRDRSELGADLSELVAREWIRLAPTSSMAGEAEYSFRHILARDVAYAALPRPSRAAKHAAAGRWIESKSGQRLEDVADVLAYHYGTALELARASGSESAEALAAPAYRFLSLAGERALQFDSGTAVEFLGRALEVAADGPERPDALERYGTALSQAGRFQESIDVLEKAIAGFHAAGRPRKAGSAMLAISDPLRTLGRMPLTRDAIELLDPLGASLELVAALLRMTSNDIAFGQYQACLDRVGRIRALIDELEAEPDARHDILERTSMSLMAAEGEARLGLRDPGGLDELEAAANAFAERGAGIQASTELLNLSLWLGAIRGPSAAIATARRNVDFARARGLRADALGAESNLALFALDAGDFAQASATLDRLERESAELGAHMFLLDVRWMRILVATQIGTAVPMDALGHLEGDMTEQANHPEYSGAILAGTALGRLALGDIDRVTAAMTTQAGVAWNANAPWELRVLPHFARICLAIARPDLLERLAGTGEEATPLAEAAAHVRAATLFEAAGDGAGALEAFSAASVGYAALGMPPEEAYAALGRGRALARLGRAGEAADALTAARDRFLALGMAPARAEAEARLAEAVSPAPPPAGPPGSGARRRRRSAR